MAKTDHPRKIRELADQVRHPDVADQLNQAADDLEARQETAKRDRIADELAAVAKAAGDVAAEAGLSLEDREGVRKATSTAQLRYLREVSPAAAAAYEQSRVA